MPALWLRWRTRGAKCMGVSHQLGHAVGIKLAHRVFAMLAHRQRADVQFPGDFLAGQSIADQANDLDLAWPQFVSQRGKGLEGCSVPAEAVACAVSWAVVLRFSLCRMLARCLRTVNSDIASAPAMRLQFIVLPISASTSRSLPVRRDIATCPRPEMATGILKVYQKYKQSIVDKIGGDGAVDANSKAMRSGKARRAAATRLKQDVTRRHWTVPSASANQLKI